MVMILLYIVLPLMFVFIIINWTELNWIELLLFSIQADALLQMVLPPLPKASNRTIDICVASMLVVYCAAIYSSSSSSSSFLSFYALSNVRSEPKRNNDMRWWEDSVIVVSKRNEKTTHASLFQPIEDHEILNHVGVEQEKFFLSCWPDYLWWKKIILPKRTGFFRHPESIRQGHPKTHLE